MCGRHQPSSDRTTTAKEEKIKVQNYTLRAMLVVVDACISSLPVSLESTHSVCVWRSSIIQDIFTHELYFFFIFTLACHCIHCIRMWYATDVVQKL